MAVKGLTSLHEKLVSPTGAMVSVCAHEELTKNYVLSFTVNVSKFLFNSTFELLFSPLKLNVYVSVYIHH